MWQTTTNIKIHQNIIECTLNKSYDITNYLSKSNLDKYDILLFLKSFRNKNLDMIGYELYYEKNNNIIIPRCKSYLNKSIYPMQFIYFPNLFPYKAPQASNITVSYNYDINKYVYNINACFSLLDKFVLRDLNRTIRGKNAKIEIYIDNEVVYTYNIPNTLHVIYSEKINTYQQNNVIVWLCHETPMMNIEVNKFVSKIQIRVNTGENLDDKRYGLIYSLFINNFCINVREIGFLEGECVGYITE